MKKTLMITATAMALLCLGTLALAQAKPMDQPSEKNIQITQGPTVTNISGNAATITWTTDKTAANHVKYRVAGSGNWQSAYHPGGSRDHSLQLTNLQPGQTYEWQILTRDGDVRTSGQFQAAATAGGAMPPVSSGGAPGAPGTPSGTHVPIYRLDNPTTGGHLYTTTSSVSAPGYNPIGVMGYIASSQEQGTVPFYHMVGPKGDNLYTPSADERNQLLGKGYQDQGVLGYIAMSQLPGTEPLHRLYNNSNGQHFYTTRPTDITQATNEGYHDEGVTGYIWAQP